MYFKRKKPYHVITYIIIVITMLSACSTSIRYVKRDIATNSIQKTIEPGAKVQLKTKDLMVRMRVTGYEDSRIIVGEDLFGGHEVKIAIDEIEEIGIEEEIYSGTNYNYKEGYEDWTVADELLLGALLLPGIVIAPIWLPYEKARKMELERERKVREEARLRYKGMTKKQIQSDIGEPIQRYLCISESEYTNKDIHLESIHEVITPGDNIQVTTADLLVRMKVIGFENNKYLVGVDEFGGTVVKVAIEEIEGIGRRRAIETRLVWEFSKEQILKGWKYIIINPKSEIVYESSESLPWDECDIINGVKD